MTVHLTYHASCLGSAYPATPCDWTHDGDGADKAAEKHTKATGHGTHCTGTPEGSGK